jgi:hypothetical protein
MIPVEYPEPLFKTKKEGDRTYIFCLIRRVWLLLTEEEWVRQNFLQYLISVPAYPASMMAVEKEIQLGELKKRFDILVYDREHKPWMLIECKEPSIALNENVLQQVLRYGTHLPVKYLLITNGGQTVGWRKEDGRLIMVDNIPVDFI